MKLQKENIPFTMVANDVLCDKALSWKAKGLYAYLFSKPDGWDFAGRRIMAEGSDGKHVVFSGLKELEDRGYLERVKSPTGRLDYVLKHSTHIPKTGMRLFDDPDPKNCKSQKLQIPKTGTVSNKEVNKEGESHSNKETAGDSKMIVEIIDLFSQVNPSYRRWFSNKTERAAIVRLVEIHGENRIREVIGMLPKTNIMPYVCRITSPYQLELKWADLHADMAKARNKAITARPNVIM